MAHHSLCLFLPACHPSFYARHTLFKKFLLFKGLVPWVGFTSAFTFIVLDILGVGCFWLPTYLPSCIDVYFMCTLASVFPIINDDFTCQLVLLPVGDMMNK